MLESPRKDFGKNGLNAKSLAVNSNSTTSNTLNDQHSTSNPDVLTVLVWFDQITDNLIALDVI